jgi:hypothetical protein
MPSECVGQWDWYSVWPECNSYVPAYDVVEVCTEDAWCNADGSSCSPALGNCDVNSHTCDCGESHYECFSYCQPIAHDCHEGFAVAHEYIENGPPEWAKASEEEEVIPGNFCGE